MILHGSQRGGARDLAAHLMKPENEHVEVHEVRGFVADTLVGALREAEAISPGTKCRRHLYSLSLNPPETESVPIESFESAIDRVEAKLEGADLPLRPAEALTFYLTGAAAAILGAAVLTRSMMTVLVVLIVAMVLPGFSVDFMAKRRKKKFTAMLPDMLTLLAGTLRAGYSIGQGIEAVSNEIDDPMGKELRRAVTEARLGRPLDEALEGIAQRLDSEDFGWAVMAIRIQREVGGNLAELLMTVADTMVQRERLRRDVAALTAEGRMSAIILGLLPPGLAVVMYVMNPEYISKLFSGMGLYLLVGAVVMMIIGFVWMKKTITIEV